MTRVPDHMAYGEATSTDGELRKMKLWDDAVLDAAMDLALEEKQKEKEQEQ